MMLCPNMKRNILERLVIGAIALQMLNAGANAELKHAPSVCSAKSSTIVKDNNTWPWYEFVTSNATPPVFNIQSTEDPSPGYIFMTQQNGTSASLFPKEVAPFIFDHNGELVWAGMSSNTANLRPATLFNESVISYWEGAGAAATSGGAADGYGKVVILDSSYNRIYEICPNLNLTLLPGLNPSCYADIHESYVTANDSILITAYNVTTADLRSIGGPEKGYVYDSLVFEIDIATNETLFSWSPLSHVPINVTHSSLDGAGVNASNPFDWFHVNSIQPFEDRYLINGRNAWTTYLVNKSGEIIWQISGDMGGDFGTIPDGGKFVSIHGLFLACIPFKR